MPSPCLSAIGCQLRTVIIVASSKYSRHGALKCSMSGDSSTFACSSLPRHHAAEVLRSSASDLIWACKHTAQLCSEHLHEAARLAENLHGQLQSSAMLGSQALEIPRQLHWGTHAFCLGRCSITPAQRGNTLQLSCTGRETVGTNAQHFGIGVALGVKGQSIKKQNRQIKYL